MELTKWCMERKVLPYVPSIRLNKKQEEFVTTKKHSFSFGGRQMGQTTAVMVKALDIAINKQEDILVLVSSYESSKYMATIIRRELEASKTEIKIEFTERIENRNRITIHFENGATLKIEALSRNSDTYRGVRCGNIIVDKTTNGVVSNDVLATLKVSQLHNNANKVFIVAEMTERISFLDWQW